MSDLIPPVSGSGAPSARTGERPGTRLRIIKVIALLTATRGFADVTLAEVIAQAGVARATFYKHFRDMQDCLLASQRHYAEQLIEDLSEHPEDPWSRLATFSSQHPHVLAILAEVQIAGEEAVLNQHDEIRDRVAAATRRHTETDCKPDLPPSLLVGTVMRVLARQGRQDKPDPAVLSNHIHQWLAHYTVSNSSARWQEPEFVDAIQPLALDWPPGSTALEAHQRQQPKPGRTSEARRQSILRAVMHTVEKRGYEHTTVREVAAVAGISREVFYIHFADKVAAFQAIHEIVFGDVMALCMRAFAQTHEWPEQVWSSGHVFASYFSSHPVLARFSFVDSLTSGPVRAKHQLDGYMTAFMAFLDPADRSDTQQPTYWTAQLIAAAIFELGYQLVRSDLCHRLPSLLPFSAYFTLTPFLGYEAANRFVDDKLAQLTDGRES